MRAVCWALAAAAWTLAAFLLLRVGRRVARAWQPAWPSNCLLWALAADGTLYLQPSAYGPWLHALSVDAAGVARKFVPVRPKAAFCLPRLGWPPLLFQGRVRIV